MNSINIKFYIHPIYKDYAATENGYIYSLKNGQVRLIKESENNYGYLRFDLWTGSRDSQKSYLSHRFIFECFNNRLIEKEKDIDHINKDKKDNRILNLREVCRNTNQLNKYNNKEIDELPFDAVKIIKYNSHNLENYYFSPSTNCIYRYSDDYLFEIPFKSQKRIHINNSNNNLTIYLNKLRKNLGFR